MKANQTPGMHLPITVNVIAWGTGTATFRVVRKQPANPQAKAGDPQGAEPVGHSHDERQNDIPLRNV
jgi:hypothetical protein